MQNIFSASVGNLPPGKAVVIGLTYCMELAFDEDRLLSLTLPTTPYAPNRQTPKFPEPKIDQYTKEVPYGLSLSVNYRMSSMIKKVSSPSHKIEFEFGDTPQEAKVRSGVRFGGVSVGVRIE